MNQTVRAPFSGDLAGAAAATRSSGAPSSAAELRDARLGAASLSGADLLSGANPARRDLQPVRAADTCWVCVDLTARQEHALVCSLIARSPGEYAYPALARILD